ncbi:hypothetical protein Tco_0221757 [Tanacetum coccineum]
MLEDLAKLVPNVKADFKDLDTPEYEPIIVVDDSEEDEEEGKNDEIHSTTNDEIKDTLASTPPFPRSIQIQELTNQILSAHDSRSSLPTELKELPSKFNELTDEVKALKIHVYGLEIEVWKLEGGLNSLNWELPAEFFSVPNQVTSAQAKLKTLDALLSLLLKVTQDLNMFAKVLHSATSKAGDQRVPSAGQASTMSAEGEKNTNQATIS